MVIVETIQTSKGGCVVVEENQLQQVNQMGKVTFSDLITKFLNSTRSLQTRRSYKYALKDFFNVSSIYGISLEMVKEVNIMDVEDYLDRLIEKGLKSSTIKARLSACSSFFEYLLSFRSNEQDIKLLNFNPFKNGVIKQEKAKKITKHDEQPTQTLTDDELKKLYRVIDTSKLKGKRDLAIIKVLLNAALRRSELVNLRIKDIYERDFEYWIHVERGKGNKNRDNFINTEVVKIIDAYLTATGRSIKDQSEDFIFKGVSRNKLNGIQLTADAVKQLIEKYCQQAGINKKISPHSFRHKAVTTLLENNVKPELVMEFCDHASINTTMRYWHNLDKVKNNAGRSISL